MSISVILKNNIASSLRYTTGKKFGEKFRTRYFVIYSICLDRFRAWFDTTLRCVVWLWWQGIKDNVVQEFMQTKL